MSHRPNRLSEEKSPYLLQHAYNPVDWYPWGPEAFAAARERDRPIFLSVGYATCHWCHVMERESFENADIARLLNAGFVSIKLDREERPDVDRIYMMVVQATTGSGGWPMSVFLTPQLHPFFAGTYFPPSTRYGRAGFAEILQRISDLWRDQREELVASAERLVTSLQAAAGTQGAATVDTSTVAVALRDGYDQLHGGFGTEPKFPRPVALRFLQWYSASGGGSAEQALEAGRMATNTLDAMAAGGINDQLGGGFHRYSVDRQWRVPHFEKMLYDQAQLAEVYLTAYLASGEARHATTVRSILDYVLRDMQGDHGGFFSAEDADSAVDAECPQDKKEGAFYLWQRDELSELLGERLADVVTRVYGVLPTGNTLADPHGEFRGGNVLYRALPVADTDIEDLSISHRVLLDARERRPRPLLDDKVLVGWNALTIGALARAGAALDEPRYTRAAEKAYGFIGATLRTPAGLLRRYRDGDARYAAGLGDWAALANAALDLYEATGNGDRLRDSDSLVAGLLERFLEEGCLYEAESTTQDLIIRSRDGYDGAEPAGVSLATLAMTRLGWICGDSRLLDQAREAVQCGAAELEAAPSTAPLLAMVAGMLELPPNQVVLSGDPRDARLGRLRDVVAGTSDPQRVVIWLSGPDSWIARRNPQLADMASDPGPRVFVCRDFHCELPSDDPEVVRARLSGVAGRPPR